MVIVYPAVTTMPLHHSLKLNSETGSAANVNVSAEDIFLCSWHEKHDVPAEECDLISTVLPDNNVLVSGSMLPSPLMQSDNTPTLIIYPARRVSPTRGQTFCFISHFFGFINSFKSHLLSRKNRQSFSQENTNKTQQYFKSDSPFPTRMILKKN